MRRLSCLLLFLVLFSCESRKPVIEITKENLKEVLTQYGKENPETEVTIETPYGNIRLKLYEDTPLHRANFIKLVKEGTYENAEFYRIFYQFMIQAGIYPKELPYTIPAEFNPKYIHKKGALSMARSDENNPNLESSSSEFFIVHGSTYADYQVENEESNNNLKLTDEQKKIYMEQGGYMSLDQKYTVFGEVVDGLEVIDKIASVKTFSEDKPLKKIPIKVTVK
ncbi:peptidylprolyl isomerase [Chryseosolibacter indicus]|uniref:Peptidyl-prolyl cis-trans isomerase n=1 Tax=Chryseosolibacter indicus TaxID=2782351 RepID=A0ABS5VLP5_9BACT|nr:peptidylprolyl isomerase [Chryseosolibacter indicus]MBT1701918.1 peptidylprolyl isomerase [Chryseosolibacter indicus]